VAQFAKDANGLTITQGDGAASVRLSWAEVGELAYTVVDELAAATGGQEPFRSVELGIRAISAAASARVP